MEKIKIKIGGGDDEQASEGAAEGFNHEEHMAKMLEGIKSAKAALDAGDVESAKSALDSLLGEEIKEEKAEGVEEMESKPMGLKERLMGAMK